MHHVSIKWWQIEQTMPCMLLCWTGYPNRLLDYVSSQKHSSNTLSSPLLLKIYINKPASHCRPILSWWMVAEKPMEEKAAISYISSVTSIPWCQMTLSKNSLSTSKKSWKTEDHKKWQEMKFPPAATSSRKDTKARKPNWFVPILNHLTINLQLKKTVSSTPTIK